VRAARVETLGAEAVDVFYVTDAEGGLLTDPESRQRTVRAVLSALTPALAGSAGSQHGTFGIRVVLPVA